MKKTTLTKALSCILCVVLIAAMALIATSCSTQTKEAAGALQTVPVNFTFIVRDGSGNEEIFELESSRTYLLDALLDENLVDGDDQSAGFYVKSVNGITADYNVDQTYWALYIDGEYATTGADTTPIVEGKTYTFAVEG